MFTQKHFLQRQYIFCCFTVFCLSCMFNHYNCKVYVTVNDTFYYLIPFLVLVLALT